MTNPSASPDDLELAEIEPADVWQQLQDSSGVAAGCSQAVHEATQFALSRGVPAFHHKLLPFPEGFLPFPRNLMPVLRGCLPFTRNSFLVWEGVEGGGGGGGMPGSGKPAFHQKLSPILRDACLSPEALSLS